MAFDMRRLAESGGHRALGLSDNCLIKCEQEAITFMVSPRDVAEE